jgi:hypothetical protein
VPNLTNIVVTDGALSRFSSPTGVAFSGGAYDPRRDEVLGVTPGGTLWRLVGTTWVPGGETGRVDAGLVWAPSVDAVLLVGGLDADGGRPFGDVARLDGGRLATLPPGVTQPLASWDFLEHTVRLIDRGRDATWLLVDGGFVAQPATGARIDWWASWPARGDALLNPGAPFASVWRSSQRTPWNLVTLPDGRTEPNLLARPERGDVLVVGGSSGGFPYRFGVSWQHERSTEPFPSPTAFGGSALWVLPDGGLVMVGGATLDATGQPAPNREVWTWSEATGGWTPRWQGAPSTFGTWATPLPDGTVLVAANEQLPQDRATSYRLRLLEDGGVERLPASGDSPSLLSTCAARDDRGAMVLLGGLQQSCGDAGACTRAPTREVYRATSTGWTRDARLRLPSTREGHACAFDGSRQSWLVFGGREGSTPATTLREFGPDGGGWASRADFAPDGRPALREGSSMVFDPSSERLVMVGGRALGSFTGLAELWVLENATVTPGLAWRVSLRELGVPLTARWERLTASAVAGGNANLPDGGAAEGVELLVWVDGQWRALGTWGADAGTPTRESVTATTLDSSWFERHSVSVGVRSVGQRRQGEAELAVDLVELELDYVLTE